MGTEEREMALALHSCPSRGATGAAWDRPEQGLDASPRIAGLSAALEAANERSAALAAELQAERHRRETAENLALSLFNVAAEERKSLLAEREGRASDAAELEAERERRRVAEGIAMAVLRWGADERHALEALGTEVEAQRRELQLSDNWREYNVRVKMHEASLELAERVDALEGLHCALKEELAARGLASLWEKAHSMVAETKRRAQRPLVGERADALPQLSTGAALLGEGRVLNHGSAALRQEASGHRNGDEWDLAHLAPPRVRCRMEAEAEMAMDVCEEDLAGESMRCNESTTFSIPTQGASSASSFWSADGLHSLDCQELERSNTGESFSNTLGLLNAAKSDKRACNASLTEGLQLDDLYLLRALGLAM